MKYINDAQQRILKILIAMAGYETAGIEPSALAKGLTINPSAITRDLSNLSISGLAEKLENGNWRLTPKIVQVSISFAENINRAQHDIDEITNRYSRQPR